MPLRSARPARARAIALVAAAAAATTLLADVYRTLRGSASERLHAIGGEALYQSEATVNGAPARIAAFGFSGSPAGRAPELARALGIALPRAPAESVLLTGASGSEQVHLLILPADLDKTLALLITSEPPRPSHAPRWPDLPRPAGAEPTFTASLAATRATLVLATVPQPPGEAAAELDRLIRDAGWAPAAPATPAFALYQRRNALFASLVLDGDAPGASRILLLRRLGQSN